MNMIKLTLNDPKIYEPQIYVNKLNISTMNRSTGRNSFTHIIMNSTGTYLYVKETPEEIIKLIEEGEK